MKTMINRIKYLGAIIITAALLAIVPSQLIKAQGGGESVMIALLQAIAESTDGILKKVNNLPDYLNTITEFTTSFMKADADSMKDEQNLFANMASGTLNNEASQFGMQQKLITDFFGPANINPTVLPNINDLSYPTLLGTLLLKPDPRSQGGPGAGAAKIDPSYNYLINASGLGAPMEIPALSWRGDRVAQKNYQTIYNTVTAVQTYNGYILSRLYQDSKTPDTSTRQSLITQSSSSDWFTQVATNNLGWVFRQILIYNSQVYVSLDRLIELQRQLLATQAMTNTLLMLQNQISSGLVLQRAKGQ